MDCKYCYSKKKYKVDKERIKQNLKNILSCYDIKNVTITGGEPLLQYDFIIYIIDQLHSEKVTIITNGLLLDQIKIDKLNAFGVEIILSIDGFSDLHGEKKPTKKLLDLIRNNSDYLKCISKVITKNNASKMYEDYMKLFVLGFRKIDLMPQMYTRWEKKDADIIIHNFKKILRHSIKNNVDIPLLDPSGKKIYEECNKIRILPDGDISICNSLNCINKLKYVHNPNEFESFRKSVISPVIQELRKHDFRGSDRFCLIDAAYYDKINNDETLISVINLLSEIHKITEII